MLRRLFTPNKKKQGQPKQKHRAVSREIPLDWILWYLSENSISEIVAVVNGQSVTLGTSAEAERSSYRFFNKQYYIGNEIFHSAADFAVRLHEIAPSAALTVLSIDDLAPTDDNFNFTRSSTMKNKLTRLLKQDENSKRKAIISASVWLLGTAAIIIIAELCAYEAFQQTASNVIPIDPLGIGFLLCSALGLIVFLPLICFSYHHIKGTDSPLLTKAIKFWRNINLAFVGLSLLAILAETAQRFGLV